MTADGADRPDQPERPTKDEGELYLYSEEDIAEAMGELYPVVYELEGVDEQQAEEIVDYTYDLLTGDFAARDPD